MHRLFVALSLPEVVEDALSQLQSGLDGARWLAADGFHLTLQFIGECDRRALDDVADTLAGVAAPGFDLTLAGAGFFGDGRPRALWAGVAPSPALVHLQSKTANALRRLGLRLEKRKFSPHVTLAYLASVTPEAAARFCAGHGLFRCGPFPVREFHLFESFLGGEAAHYDIVATYPLAPPA